MLRRSGPGGSLRAVASSFSTNPDQDMVLRAVEDARRILGEYVKPDPARWRILAKALTPLQSHTLELLPDFATSSDQARMMLFGATLNEGIGFIDDRWRHGIPV
jgi:hypothetical protein